jgi:uncharacterized protein YdcH (DUF465 family)
MKLFNNHNVTANMVYNIQRNVNELNLAPKTKQNTDKSNNKKLSVKDRMRIYLRKNKIKIQQIDDPNYYVNEQGIRESQRTKKKSQNIF